MDIYLPNDGEGPFPMILFARGGGYFTGDKGDDETYPPIEGLKRGYAVCAINYTDDSLYLDQKGEVHLKKRSQASDEDQGYAPANPILRIAAFAIDAMIVAIAWFALTVGGIALIASIRLGTTDPGGGLLLLAGAWLLLTPLLAGAMWLVYGTALESSPVGATIGKRLCAIRVIDSTGQSPEVFWSLIRTAPKFFVPLAFGEGLMPGSALMALGLLVSVGLPGTSGPPLNPPTVVTIGLVTILWLTILLSQTGQGLHDHLAGTMVAGEVTTSRFADDQEQFDESAGSSFPSVAVLPHRPSIGDAIAVVGLTVILAIIDVVALSPDLP